MSIDGSFDLQSELTRFITRSPNLKSNPKLTSLLQKGDKIKEEEVVTVISELFLCRNYTIPIIGCFRPILRCVVEKAVELLLLVPVLSSANGRVTGVRVEMEIDGGGDDDDDDAEVIEKCVRSGRIVELHEMACFAFSRALDLAPFLLQSILRYFKSSSPPFQRLLESQSVSQLVEKDGAQLLDAVRVSFRLLLIDPHVFSELWDWSLFLDLVHESTDISGEDSDRINIILDLRWCAVQILSITLKMSDRASTNFGLDAEKSLACFFRWEDFCQDVSLEKAGFYLNSDLLRMGKDVDADSEFNIKSCLKSFKQSPLNSSLLKSCRVDSPRKSRRQISGKEDPLECPFFLTSAVKKSFEMVLMAVSQKWPVLLNGPTGSGKTAVINYLAKVSGNRVLSIHMDEQMDGKTLIGSYVCTEKPGEFRWQPGSLTQAITNGFWVIFEDIDKAPSDVQSILLPLLEGANSFVTGRGEAIGVADSFRLFATVSTHKPDGKNSLGVLWRSVMISPAADEDLSNIIKEWYPELEAMVKHLLETYECVTSSHLHHFGASHSYNRFSLRNLLRWCKRIVSLDSLYAAHGLSAHERKYIYQEAVDIFVAYSGSSTNRLSMMREIAKIWGVPEEEAETLYPHRKPSIQELKSEFQIGRVSLKLTKNVVLNQTRPFVDIGSSLHVLERIACSVKHKEPVLLVGETGTGKTTLVQNLANRIGQPLVVLNLSQQSDIADLLGGLKPTDPQFLCVPLYNEFIELLPRTFSKTRNDPILQYLKTHRDNRNWKKILEALQKGYEKVQDLTLREPASGKRKRPLSEELLKAWELFSEKLIVSRRQIDASSGLAFSFVEGAFVTALRKGHWILLDEINLAPPETLQRIMGVLEGEKGSLCLTERGDIDYIKRHHDFRVFACMNPATDAGKRDLPFSLRGRFTEYFVDEILDEGELTLFINQFVDDSCPDRKLVNKIVQFYLAAKRLSEERLQDGANQKPQFSLRSLYRALEYLKKAQRQFGYLKALYDGFCMFFLTLLDEPSAKVMNEMICKKLLEGSVPRNVPYDSYLVVAESSKSDPSVADYILTDSVKEHLRNLARAVLIKRYPILLQGPTSSGKTSLVRHLAAVTGHEFVRINNHEHTDLQEYLGSYITDATGKLVFQEGVLVKAVRSGCWIVLDELNLAPSDVLEALNRLLDDNRELFVPELQETIKAHPNFMLFATQNPPTLYAGRKMLSRAFRNRFVELHVGEIPENELTAILKERCKIPETYAKKMVNVMKDLQLHRQSSKVFAGKHGFITPRDLFRWADRYRELGNSCEDLVKDGYYLLAERLRDENEKKVVREVLLKVFRPVKLEEADLYKEEGEIDFTAQSTCNGSGVVGNHGSIIWTKSMRRLYFLVERCYKLREPVLLVGETAGGKTTVCQLLSTGLGRALHILNCHQFTETSDFLGGFYPVRDRSVLIKEFKDVLEELMLSNVVQGFPKLTLSSDIGQASQTLAQLNDVTDTFQRGQIINTNITRGDLDTFEQMKMKLVQLHQKWQTIFTWHDGPLIETMKSGDLFLVDEISLADDSVLERLNSVLEPERKLSLAEKGGSMLENITAHPNFFLLATMNPGGDYGKKELSPALRNRFTEIWVPPVCDPHELHSIALSFAGKSLAYTVDPMLKFWDWFSKLHISRSLTVRDLLSWIEFMNATVKSFKTPNYAFVHGAFLVLLDGLSLGTGISKHDAAKLREQCLSYLLECLKEGNYGSGESELSRMETFGWGDIVIGADTACDDIVQSDQYFGINPFCITKGDDDCKPEGFEFLSPTTCRNAMRVLRAMQLVKPVLLEGSPGVGKTSLIVALGKFSGHRVVRINLSEQTDIMDLLGSDFPVEDAEGMKFAWSDGILLQALKNGDWVLLDELNLAPQSVLEGLNAILDHRAEVFIPELGQTYRCPASFRVFACQNPSSQGGGRKGLPKSFLNRFTKVYVDELVEDDYLYICKSLHPSIPEPLLRNLICFNKRLYMDTMISRKYGLDGSPWEFNLRDVIRSCQIMEGSPGKSKADCFLSIVYIQRMRTATDRQEVVKLYEEVFGVKPNSNTCPAVHINPHYLIVGNTYVERNHLQSRPSEVTKSQLKMLPGSRYSLEAVAHCVQYQWLCILVGPSASGKTSLIRLLAHLSGHVLHELNLSSATDISELLGCFEQYNAFRTFRSAMSQLENFVNEYISLSLESSSEKLLLERKGLVTRWLTFLSSTNSHSLSRSAPVCAESWNSVSDSSLSSLIQIIEELKSSAARYQLPVSWSLKDLNEVLKSVIKLLEHTKKQSFSAKFEWVTGILVKAIECGEWIVLKNANLCNPTVLDRINSLVEPSGSITINECGLVDGRPMILCPNKKFRLFLTVNPKFGEVSRAMRNRGIEVFMMQPDWIYKEDGGYNSKGTDVYEVKRFLVMSGIPFSLLVEMMTEAHIFARNAGVNLGVQITLVELTRWVQLFQQLLVNGNRPLWSLHVSWEHTYLSSLGEFEGRSAVEHVKNSYLSGSNLSKLGDFLIYSLSLPGGWPAPLRLRNFVWNSTVTCVKQNCMYLKYLADQFASYEVSCAHHRSLALKRSFVASNGDTLTPALNGNNDTSPSLLPLNKILQVLFPTDFHELSSLCTALQKFDLTVFSKMIIFSANWIIEQATEGDLKFYLLWFTQYSIQLTPYCRLFESYLNILKEETIHPIWTSIFDSRRELITHYEIDLETQTLPLLSSEILDLTASDGILQSVKTRLSNSVKCVDLLRHTLQQWKVEDQHNHLEGNQFSPVLKSLRELEKEVLNTLVDSPSFEFLFGIYSNVIEHHSLLWDGILSSKYESMIISWRSLKKDARKLVHFFPKAVKDLLVQSSMAVNMSPWNCQSTKSMLWAYGGHPFLPSSADTHSLMEELRKFCRLIWPTGKYILVEGIVSANTELRSLATQGVAMSSLIVIKDDQDEASLVQKLQEMHQILMGRVEYEKQKLNADLVSITQTSVANYLSDCCVFCPDKLHKNNSFSSWLEMFDLFDSTSFFFDMELLKEFSSAILLEDKQLYEAISNSSMLLRTSMDFSLKFSSRPPTDFVPHQALLWVLDAWKSVDSVRTKVASSILEMWFRWHSLLWTQRPDPLKVEGSDSPLPHMLFQQTRTATLDRILKTALPIIEFGEHHLKLRVASGNLWHDYPSKRDIPSILLSAARSLFEQIIYAHEKSFEKEKYGEIKSIFSSIRRCEEKVEKLQSLRMLISSTSNKRLSSVIDSSITPLLNELYLHSSTLDSLENLGRAWLHIGSLRFHLLLTPDDLDPAIKYSIRHSQIVEKISVLELEIKVRQESEDLIGRSSNNNVLQQKRRLIDTLETECRRIKRKVVYRPDASQFTRLKSECADFLELTASSAELAKNMTTTSLSQFMNKALNWQETATSFIDRLSKEYAAYADIIQPVQVAVYEMKLGLSLVLSSALQKMFLAKMEEGNTERIEETIYNFTQFPRGFSEALNYGIVNKGGSKFPSDEDLSSGILALDLNLLEKIFTISRDNISDKALSGPQSHAALCHNIFVRLVHVVVNSQLISHKSFKLLQQIFDKFAGLWMSMKIQTKEKEEDNARSFKFKTRQFKIEDILDVEVSSLQNILSDDSLRVEWKEMMEEEEGSIQEEHENLEKEWGIIQDSILDSMVHIHNQFFGSRDLVADLGFNQISDAEKLSSFHDSYKLGLRMLKGVPALLSSSLDAKLVPEHLLSVCLEYKEKFGGLDHLVSSHNIYKNSNASILSKMVNPLLALKHRVQFLLHEWPDHPGLERILDLVEMLLAVPLTTPLAKVLSGLQFLFTKAHQLHENAPKLSLSDLMQPLLDLGLAWLRMEIESWPALLDGVQEQYEINSRKLWFPLYSVLYRGQSADISGDIRSTIQSLEEFIQTSSIGEFQRRLQLLLAFHGQISTGLKFDSCWSMIAVTGETSKDDLERLTKYMEHMKKILYNVFGYYVQFLPVVLEHIKVTRKSVSKELSDIVKLSRWDRADNYLLMDSTKRLRQKLKKHIQKFNDVLQQSVMVILNKEAEKGGIVARSEVNIDSERSKWYMDWRKKADFALEYCSPKHISGYNLQYLNSKDSEDTECFVRCSLNNQSVSPIYSEEWKGFWISLENICRTIIECGDLWDIEKKSIGKRRALSDLLKLLESCGLSRRTSIVSEDVLKSNQPRSWFLQPSYHVEHLLLPSIGNATVDGGSSSSLFQMPLRKNSDANWKVANEFYFRSMAMVQLLRQICLNFHKDLSLDQVTKSSSFLEHLISVQQEQRSFAYTFSEDLKKTRNCVDLIEGLYAKPSVIDNIPNSESSVSLKQDVLRKFMWYQKKLFDDLYAISQETSLLLRNVEVTHLNSCKNVKVEANSLLALIEKFIPNLRKSKESLDQYLLGGNGILTTSEAFLRPLIVSKKMEELVKQNFNEISELGDCIQALFEKDVDRSSVGHHLIGRFVDIFSKAKMTMQEYFSVLEPENQAITPIENIAYLESEDVFAKSFNKTATLIREVFQKLGAESNGVTYSEDSVSVNITRWKVLAESYRENIKLDRVCKQLGETITSAVHLIDHAGTQNPNICCQVQTYLNYLQVLVDPILTLGEDFLLEFLTMHKTVGEMTHMLAQVFATLFSKGFGGPQADDTVSDAPEELVPGTGMSDGKGEKDVSDQLESEDQLERTSEKPDEDQDTKTEPPSKDEKGIEMDQEFNGEEFNLSEDSDNEDNTEESEDEKLDSTVGDTGENDERVDEKPWDKDDDDNPDTKNEQNESGPAMKDLDSNSLELRAKEDDTDEPGDANSDKDNGKEDQNDTNVDEEIDNMDIDKEASNIDPTGLQTDEPNEEVKEDATMEDPDDTMDEEPQDTEEIDPENVDETLENENENDDGDEETEKENTESGKVEECPDGDDTMKDQNEVADMDLSAPSKDTYNQGESNFTGNSNSGMQLNAETLTSESAMSDLSNTEEMQRGLAPSMGLPSTSTSETQLTLPDSMDGGKLTADNPNPNPKPESSQEDNKSMERANPNPYRSVGDALEKWKERVKVSVDAEENNTDNMEEEGDVDEYGFVPESEKGTSQALGPATSEQINHNINGSNNPDGDEDLPDRKDDKANPKKQDSEILPSKFHNAASMQKLAEEMQNSDLNDKAPLDETPEDDVDTLSKDLVTVEKSYMDDDSSLSELNNLTIDDEEFGKAKILEMSTDFADASALWRKYEQITTRLSQELAEQLRLVMEPTVASKLQGDYKTGKRINMKKVIAYIASHYRKDKIWLRRTRPNKRDYQVVVAVDDSRSMSESHCGDVAIEALVTVCRAMSQLEVAQLAVASFGTKGNIKLLHDFDQHFTGESGMKMISSLKFEQENTIEDKPVLDLLMYLNNKLDSAATNSRLPSGQSPLQQLVLIISDGFLHEKERVKRYVRDLLSKNRMVAFLIIDPKDTITHLPEISIEEGTGKMITSKYLNSFPFPYYIVLKDIEALPRTLADLLRQWFELMQSARD